MEEKVAEKWEGPRVFVFYRQQWLDNYNYGLKGADKIFIWGIGVEGYAYGLVVSSGDYETATAEALKALEEGASVKRYEQGKEDVYNQYGRWVGTDHWVEEADIPEDLQPLVRQLFIALAKAELARLRAEDEAQMRQEIAEICDYIKARCGGAE